MRILLWYTTTIVVAAFFRGKLSPFLIIEIIYTKKYIPSSILASDFKDVWIFPDIFLFLRNTNFPEILLTNHPKSENLENARKNFPLH